MTNNPKNTNGYILAGGKSSRMGRDKGLLIFNDEAMIQTIIDQVEPAVNKTIIVSNNPAYKKFGLEIIPDIIKEKGPAGGIHATLQHTDSDKIFVVSCDMPFISSKAIQYLLREASQAQITLPLHHGKPEPLFAVYSKECLPLWQQLIQQEMVKLQEMVSCFDLRTINIDDNELFHDSFFLNINDENDLKKALKQTDHGH